MKRRIFSLLLAIVMLVSVLPTTSLADTAAPTLANASADKKEVSKLQGVKYTYNLSAVKKLFSGTVASYQWKIDYYENKENATSKTDGIEKLAWEALPTAGVSYTGEEIGVYLIQVKAVNSAGESPIYTFELTVKENTKPYLIEGKSGEITAEVFATVEYALPIGTYFADSDSSKLTYYVSIDGGEYTKAGTDTNKTSRFTYTNTWKDAGTHTLKFNVCDEITTLQDAYTVNLTVKEPVYDAEVWNGISDSRWYTDNPNKSEYTLTTPAQVAGLAAIVNGVVDGVTEDFKGKTIKLGKDIKLNDVSFVYHEDVNRVEISNGKDSVFYAPNAAKGTATDAPDNIRDTFYKEKIGTETVISTTAGTQITCNGVTWQNWSPIGNSSKIFAGNFDGNGYSISGLSYINASGEYAGLFGKISGTVKQVTVTGFVAGRKYVGSVAGYMTAGSVTDCMNKATIVGIYNGSSFGQYIGGIVGYISNSGGEVDVKGLTNEGSVQGLSDVGGIIGYISASKKVKLNDCTNTGNISGMKSGNVNTGGIVGTVYTGSYDKNIVNIDVSELVNRGTINILNSTGAQYAGGIFGCFSAQSGMANIEDSYNIGAVKGNLYVGGILGYYMAASSYPSSLTNCYNAGKVDWHSDLDKAPDQFKCNYGSICGYVAAPFSGTKTKVENNYYTEESFSYKTCKYTDGLTKVAEDTMKATVFPVNLGESYGYDSDKINKGFPILVKDSKGSNEKSITEFKIGDIAGTVDEDTKTVTFTDYSIAAESNKLTLTPLVTVSENATVYPESGKEVAFTQDSEDATLYTCQYIVTAENGSMRAYTVKLKTKAAVSGVQINNSAICVTENYEGYQLSAVVFPVNAANQKVTWSSSDESIATVDENGLVKGISAGTVTITVTTDDGNYQKTCEATVIEFVAVTKIELPETIEVSKSESVDLLPTFVPTNATNQKVTWTSEDESIATVDENGKVTGKVDEGTVNITVTSEDTTNGTISATCKVQVKNLPVESIKVTQTKQVAVGKEKKLKVTFNPSNASNKNVTWKSDDNTIATVDKDGIVRGVRAGETIITVTANDTTNGILTDKVTIKVVDEYNYEIGWAGVFNANNNNNTMDTALPMPGQVEEVWDAAVGNSAVCVVGDYVYAYACAEGMGGFTMAGTTKTFYKVDKNTGEIVGEISDCPGSGGYYYGYVIYGDGMIFVVCPGTVMAFDIDAFEMLWSRTITYRQYCSAQYVNGCVIANGCVVDGATGQLITKLNGKYCYSTGAVVNEYFYIAGYDGCLHAFDTTTWEEKDSFRFMSDRGETSGWNVISQPGVLYHNGRFYWGNANENGLYSIALDNKGILDGTTYKKLEGTQGSVCTPVAYGNRIYLPGQSGKIDVFDAITLELIYTTDSVSGNKIQSTPILYADEKDGVYVYVQAYSESSIYCLHDTATATSGKLELVATPSKSQYAFEQMACDKDGALYVTNDTGMLFKFVTPEVEMPTFTTNLSEETLYYVIGKPAEKLEVATSLNGEGKVSYQWQKSTDGTTWTDIEGATKASYTPSTEEKSETYYRCVATNTEGGKKASAISKAKLVSVIKESELKIKVSFRLIGATNSIKDIDFEQNPGNYYGSNYETWIGTTSYELRNGTTLGELFEMVMEDAGLSYKGLERDYISSITKGGFELGEFDNGTYSGWMYTVNGKHPVLGLNTCRLADGDVVVWHYVNDYRFEDESSNPTSSYLNKWLEAADKASIDTGNAKVDAVEKLIASIGTFVTLDSKKAIEAARAAYDKLVSGRKKLVNNYDVLVAAEKELAALEKGTHTHTWDEGKITKAATCTTEGTKTYTCSCGETKKEIIKATGHSYGAWVTTSAATVFAAEVQKHTCTACGISETKTVGSKLKATIKVTATTVTLKMKQKTNKFKVTGLAKGDAVKKYESSNKKVFTVTQKGVITAGKKVGRATLTITLKSGLKKKVTVKVQKKAVTATKITGLKSKVTLKKGKKLTLKPAVKPFTCVQKVTYKTSNKKIATVTSKGVITGKKAGTAKITVTCGKKRCTVKVTVKK